MKRSPALISFSREHHSALVLAMRINRAGNDVHALAAVQPAPAFLADLEAHFSAEEAQFSATLATLPQLACRFADEHAELRALMARLHATELTVLPEFGQKLAAHVRFEERELFPALEALAAAD